jgi:hypothetical protein
MDDITLESLARRVEALERAIGVRSERPKDWRRVVGMFGDNEFSRKVDAEGQAIREAEREEARRADHAN